MTKVPVSMKFVHKQLNVSIQSISDDINHNQSSKGTGKVQRGGGSRGLCKDFVRTPVFT